MKNGMNISNETMVGDVAAADYHTASVFKQYDIDFCCHGQRSIEEVCREKGIDSAALVAQLEQAAASPAAADLDYNNWPLDRLADHIVATHHRYVETRIAEILPLLEKIVQVHGAAHPELKDVEQIFHQSAGELAAHMKKEELILFPRIRKMAQAEAGTAAATGSVQNPIRMMIHDHDGEAERFRKIATLTKGYVPPADACNTYTTTLSLLREFEEDLHLHLHLENNILFPKALELEAASAKA